MLRCTVIGNLGSDPEARYTQAGQMQVQFRIAVNQVTGKGENRVESTEWFRISVGGRQAEWAQTLVKGNRVLVIGRLNITHFTRKDGSAGTGFDVWADEVQNMSPRQSVEATEDEDEDAPVAAVAAAPARRAAPAQARRATAPAADSDLDELPF